MSDILYLWLTGLGRDRTHPSLGRLPLWVNRLIFAVGRRLPVFPRNRTSSRPVGISQKCHERKSQAYSITSSARARRDAGTSRPSDFAVLRLMTSAYLECCERTLGQGRPQ